MIDVKQAIAIAKQYVIDMYSGEEIVDVRLEETRLSEDDREWIITIGLSVPEKETRRPHPLWDPSLANQSINLVRKYKLLKIDVATGHVNAMLVRDPFAAV